MNRTKIEWVKNPDGTQGWTWNPIVGCSRGCSYCYARRFAKRSKNRCVACGTFRRHLHAERLYEISNRQNPHGIFVCSMGELFEAKDRGDTFAVFRRMFFTPQHRYYVLTRNPKIAQQYPNELGLIKNLWFGVTIESEGFIDRANWLKTIPAQVRYVSCEPLLGMIDLRPQLSAGEISWVIVGAMTGPNAIKPDSKWLSWIVQDCDQFKVPVFVKNNLVRLCPEFTGRQEMPK